jgi:hypothetical protein
MSGRCQYKLIKNFPGSTDHEFPRSFPYGKVLSPLFFSCAFGNPRAGDVSMPDVFHALGLHMHQPLGNLVALHKSDERWEARQILWCYDRPTRMLEGYEDVARLHISFSGTLLKQLEDREFGRRLRILSILKNSWLDIAIPISNLSEAVYIIPFIH